MFDCEHNHIEKTSVHECQFPIELVERLILSLTNQSDLVVDPYMGVGSTACAAVLNRRRAAGADIDPKYLKEAETRVNLAFDGSLPRRPLGKKIYAPGPNDKIARRPAHFGGKHGDVPILDSLFQ
ncbi:MAG: DNA methyltransferase [Candidatus Korobacteraceae bacterium]